METRKGLHQLESMSKCIKSFHVFDQTIPSSMANIVNQAFFVCAVLSHSILHYVYDVSTNMHSKYVLLWSYSCCLKVCLCVLQVIRWI